jgi:hypothetical protein
LGIISDPFLWRDCEERSGMGFTEGGEGRGEERKGKGGGKCFVVYFVKHTAIDVGIEGVIDVSQHVRSMDCIETGES